MNHVAVLGATGAIGGRFVEVVAGEDRAPVRALVHRWWHTARVDRYAIELRSVGATGATGEAAGADAAGLAAALDGCAAAVSFLDGPGVDPTLADAVVEGCCRAGLDRLVHLGCLGSFGAVAGGHLREDVAPPRPPGAGAARRWAFEQALLEAGTRLGVDVAVMAASLVYGPFTERGAHLPHRQVERGRVAVAAGSGRCHVVYVDDVVEAVWAALVAPVRVQGRTFVSGPAPITWPDWFAAFERIVGRAGVAVLPDAELAELVQAEPEVLAELRWPAKPSPSARLVGALERRTLRRRDLPPVRRRLVVPTPEELADRARDVAVPLTRAAELLGWSPVVPFAEGMRRTEAYLRWAEPSS